MALGNYLTPGSYTVVESIQYMKTSKQLEVSLIIYKDSLKIDVLATKHISFGGHQVKRLKGSFLTEPPAGEWCVGDAYLTAETGCTGIWVSRDRTYAVWNGNDWSHWHLRDYEIFYDEQSQSYKRLDAEYILHDTEYYSDIKIVEEWFDFSDPMLNPIKQIYTYLKQHTLTFANCEDC